MAERRWTDQQQAIFDWFAAGRGHLVVQALAGTGKTSTILEAIRHAPEETILLCAFNKRIAEELKTRLENPRAEARTLHSLGFALLRATGRASRVEQGRGERMAREAWALLRGGEAPRVVVGLVAKLAGLAKGLVARVPALDELDDIADEFGVVPERWAEAKYGLDGTTLASLALCAVELARTNDGTCDYDDMIWLPVVEKLAVPWYGLTVVDEAQDMSPVQLALARSVNGGRLAIVGDAHQAIYGFRGADTAAMARMPRELDATVLPLTTTFRCPRHVVTEAQRLVPAYEAAPEAPDGALLRMPLAGLLDTAQPGDFVLSRTNAPLVGVCLRLWQRDTAARIEGRDLAAGLRRLVAGTKATAIGEFRNEVEAWAQAARQRAKRNERKLMAVDDQVETVEALCAGLRSVEALRQRIERIFGDALGPVVVCSTVHRAKGLEAPRVFVLAQTLYCYGRRQGDPEEANIEYVAMTRAREALVLVEEAQ